LSSLCKAEVSPEQIHDNAGKIAQAVAANFKIRADVLFSPSIRGAAQAGNKSPSAELTAVRVADVKTEDVTADTNPDTKIVANVIPKP
jgi:hypothetical protein